MAISDVTIIEEKLKNIDVNDEFFDEFRKSYNNFNKWFEKKQKNDKTAYITRKEPNKITSFLLLKDENEKEDYSKFNKPFKPGKRLKISSFKVSDTGRKIGTTLMDIVEKEAKERNAEEIYATIFKEQKKLIQFLKKHGFKFFTYQKTKTGNQTEKREEIYIKNIKAKNVLMSINPEHVENILNGSKKYEYRKIKCKEKVDKMIIYSTAPVMKVVGEAKIIEILEEEPEQLWKKTKNESGINYEFYKKYFNKREKAVAYKLAEIKQYDKPKELAEYGIKTPPQSYVYV